MPITDERSVIALLPMKGHSERVPGKNMRLLNGRPLYHWIAASLQKSRYIAGIVIDTDSQEIARDAARHFPEAIVLDRPQSIRGDMVSMNTIINHDISQVKGEHFLQTHSTNPLLRSLKHLIPINPGYFQNAVK